MNGQPSALAQLLIALIIVLVSLFSSFIAFANIASVIPPLGLAVLFYFLTKTPHETTLFAMIITGLMMDITQSTPLGISLIACVICGVFIASDADSEKQETEFIPHYGQFALFSFACLGAIYMMVSLYFWNSFPIVAPLVQWVLLILCYPFVFSVCQFTSHRLKLEAEGLKR